MIDKNSVVELFAGVGGFRLALEREGFKVIYSNQWEPSTKVQHAYDCYARHFGLKNHSNTDISLVDSKDIPNHSILVGGFPCQDYSVASTLVNSKGIEGKKGVLWWQINRIVEDKLPNHLILENVDRLLKSPAKQRGRDFAMILSCLNKLNYYVEWKVINAADYGFVQKRRRVFIFATKDKKLIKKIDNKRFFKEEFNYIEVEDEKKIDIPTDLIKLSNEFSFRFEDSGCSYNYQAITAKTKPLFNGKYIVLGDILENNAPDHYFPTKEKLDKIIYLKSSKRYERVSNNGFKYMYSEGAVPFPDFIDRAGRTLLTSEGSTNRSTHIVLDPIRKEYRLLTPIETERLNGFDDNWTLGMPERTRYFCMGNALVVDIVQKIGKRLKELI